MSTQQGSCIHCGNPVDSDNPKAKFCSNKCRVYAARGLKHKPNPMKPDKASAADGSGGGPRFRFKKSFDETAGDAVAVEPVVKLDHPKGKPWLSAVYLKSQPRVFPDGMTKVELKKRLFGGLEYAGIVSGGIDGYNRYQIDNCRPQLCSSQRDVETWLAKAGYDYELAEGITYPKYPESEFLAAITQDRADRATSVVPD